MKKTWFISIRSKILFVLSAVLVSAVGLYLYLASQLFFEDKKLLVYELNQTSVRSLGQEVETHFKRISDKLLVLASMQQRDPQSLQALLPRLVADDEGFLRVALLDRSGNITPIGTWAKSLELDGKDAGHLDRIREAFPIPFDRVIQSGLWVRNTTRLAPGESPGETPATATVATRLNADQIVYADIRLDPLLQSFSGSGLAQAYLVDSEGFVLADSGFNQRAEALDLRKDPLLLAARASKVRSEVKTYTQNDIEYLGSFFRLDLGNLVVGSRTQAGQAFAAAQVLIRKSTLYALLVVTVAFLIALFLSHSLTVPIRRMVEATHQLAQGNFAVTVPVQSGDELSILARSFNAMTVDLRRSREQLVQSERFAAIGQVARSIGHEFGNILLVITGNADLGKSAPTLEKAQDRIKLISQAADRASLIVRNLNSFAKGSESRSLVDPGQLVANTLSLVDHETKKNNVTIERHLPTCAPIRIHAAEIEQVLLNLIINAIHAMPKGGTITVSIREAGPHLELSVSDTGTGISPDVLPHIFEYAFTTKGDKGSGLGLAISKQIVEAHLGTLEVTSQVGVGTTFTLKLPRESSSA